MAVNRSYEPYKALRIGLPTLIIAALGATAMHLSVPAPIETNPGLSLLTTGEVAPSPSAKAPAIGPRTTASPRPTTQAPARTKPATSPKAVTSTKPSTAALAPRMDFVPAPASLPSVEELKVDLPTAPGGSACDPINGFVITITDGELSCVEIHKVAGPYTQAVLANELGRELSWSDKGWDCIRNFDETGITANAHGLICHGTGTFVLVSE